jgi:hypothetical protein
MQSTSALRSSIRSTATMALVLTVGCAPGRRTDIASAPVAGPCQSAQQDLRTELQTLEASAEPAKRQSYAAVASRMLLLCDNEARSMNARFADDWRIHSYFVNKDLKSLVVINEAGFAKLLPEHRGRVERLFALYAGMFGNPPAPGGTR